MADIYGGPGVGRTPLGKEAIGSVVFGGGSDFLTSSATMVPVRFLIQDWNLNLTERIQEVVTLAETEHVYTFGRAISKLSLRGYFISSKARCSNLSDFFDTKKLLKEWSKTLRAKKSGEKKQPLAFVAIDPLGAFFKCVVVSMNLSNSVSQEVLLNADLQMLILEDAGDLIS